MVLPVKTQSYSFNSQEGVSDRVDEISEGKMVTGCNCHENGKSNGAKEASVKSRITFFEDNGRGNSPPANASNLRQAKSMTSLLEIEPVFEKEQASVIAKPEVKPMYTGCPFSGKRELKNVRLKNYVTSTQQNDTLHLKAKV